MAPWPEQPTEPKAPDKDEKREVVVANAKVDLDDSSESTISAKSDQKTDEKEVLTLDEGQLKALLDEAITYKNPKDREGKSELFKELLQEAEADESDSKGLGGSLGGKLPRAYYNLPVRRRQSRHGGQSRECGVGVSSTRGGSLQNLHALGMEGGRRSRKRDTLVSARQREGGSLPTNVNVDNDPDLDIICPNYTSRATLEVSGHNKEENISKEEPNVPTFLKVQGHHHLPNGTETQSTKEDDNRVVETVYASSIKQNGVHRGQNIVENSAQDVIPPQGDMEISEYKTEAETEYELLENDQAILDNEIESYKLPFSELSEHETSEDEPPENDQAPLDNEIESYKLPFSELSEHETSEDTPPENDQAPLENKIESCKYCNSKKFPVLYRRPDGRLEVIECVVVDPFSVFGDPEFTESMSKKQDKCVNKSSKNKSSQQRKNKKKDNITEISTDSKRRRNLVKEKSSLSNECSKVVYTPKSKSQTSEVMFFGGCENILNKSKRDHAISETNNKEISTQLGQKPSSSSKTLENRPCWTQIGLNTTYSNDLVKTQEPKAFIPYPGDLPNILRESKILGQDGETPPSSKKPSKIKDEKSRSHSLAKLKSSKEEESETVSPKPRIILPTIRRLPAIERRALAKKVPVGETPPSSKKPSKIKDEKSRSHSLEKLKSSKEEESETVSPKPRIILPTIRRLSAIERRALAKKVPVRCIAAEEKRKQEKQGVGPVESGAMLYPSTPVQHVSVLSIPPSQIHAGSDDHRISDSPEAKKLNVSRSRQHKKGHPMEETDNTSEGLLGLPLTAYWNRYSSFTLLDFQGMSRGNRDATKPIYTARGHPKFESLPKPSSSLPISLADLKFRESSKGRERPTATYTPSNPHNLPLSIPDYLHAVPGPSTATPSVSTGNSGRHSRGDSGVASQFKSISGPPPAVNRNRNKKAAPKGEASAAPVASAPSGSKNSNKRPKQKAASHTTKGEKKGDGAIKPPPYLTSKNPRSLLKKQTIEDPLAASQPSGSQGLPPLPTPEFLRSKILRSMIESAKKRLENISQRNPRELPISSLLSNTDLKRRKIDRRPKVTSIAEVSSIPTPRETDVVSPLATHPVSVEVSDSPLVVEPSIASPSLPASDIPPVFSSAAKKKNRRRSKPTPATEVPVAPIPRENTRVSQTLPVPDRAPVASPATDDCGKPTPKERLLISYSPDNQGVLPLPTPDFLQNIVDQAKKRRPKVTSTAEVSSIPTPRETDVVSPLATHPVSVEVSDIPLVVEPSIASPSLPASAIPPVASSAAKKKNRRRSKPTPATEVPVAPIPRENTRVSQTLPVPDRAPVASPATDDRGKPTPKERLLISYSPDNQGVLPLPTPDFLQNIVDQAKKRRPKVTSTAEVSSIPTPRETDVVSPLATHPVSVEVSDIPLVVEPSIASPSLPASDIPPVASSAAKKKNRTSPAAKKKNRIDWSGLRKWGLCPIEEGSGECCDDSSMPHHLPDLPSPPLPSPSRRKEIAKHIKRSPKPSLSTILELIGEYVCNESEASDEECPAPVPNPPSSPVNQSKNRSPNPSLSTILEHVGEYLCNESEESDEEYTEPVPDPPSSPVDQSENHPTAGKPVDQEPYVPQFPPFPSAEYLAEIKICRERLETLAPLFETAKNGKGRPKVTSIAEVSSIPTPRETDVVSPLSTHPVSVEVSDIPLVVEPSIASPSLPVSDIPPVASSAAKKKNRRRSKPTPATEVPVAPIPRENTRVSQTLPVPDRAPVASPATDDRGKPKPKERLLISYSPDNQGVLPLPTPDFLQNIVDQAKKRRPKVTSTAEVSSIPTPRETDVVSPLATHPVSIEVSDIPLVVEPSIASPSLPASDIPPVASSAAKKKNRRRSKPTPATEVPVAPIPRENTRVSQTLPVPDRAPVASPATDDRGKPTPKERLLISYSPDNQGVLPLPTPDFLQNIVDQAKKRRPKVTSTAEVSSIPTPRETDVVSPLATHPVSVEVSDSPLVVEPSIASPSLPVSDIPPVASSAAKKKNRRRSKPTPATEVPVAPIPRENTRVSQTLPVPDRAPVASPATDDRGKPTPKERLLISYSPDNQGVLPLPTPDFLQNIVDQAKKRRPKVTSTAEVSSIPTPRETDVVSPLATHPVSVEVSDIPLVVEPSIASPSLPASGIPPVAYSAAKKKIRRRSKPTPATEVPVAPIPRENTRVSQTLPVPDRAPVASPATDDSGKPMPEDQLLISHSTDTQGVLPFPSPDFLQDMVDQAKKRFDDLLQIHASEPPSIPPNSPLLAETQYKGRKTVERTPRVFTGDSGVPFLEETDEVPTPLFSEDPSIPSGIAPPSSPLPGPSGHPPPIKRMKSSESTDSAESPDEGPRFKPFMVRVNPTHTGLTERAEGDANTRLAFGNTADGKTKPLDENGNALACVRMDSNCLDRKKQRRVKAKNDRNTILSDEIEGFRGGADIDTLMEYIESPSLDSNKTSKARTNQANGTRNSVKVRAKEEEPRSIKRRKEKFQRCNSLEEISKTKLEDLTEEGSSERVNGSSHPLTKKQVTLDDAELGKKSSWEEMVETARVYETKDQKQERISPEPVQDSEFHVVTKKQRKKKKRSGCSSRGGSKQDYYSGREAGSGRLLYQYRRDQGTSQPRRKSASSVPPSDKSDSSDLDSVHSLPASSTATRARAGQNSVSGGSTPQASYADIARTAASPPDGSQVNIDRQDKCSANSSFTESYERTSTIPNPMLPMPLASFKKDAMTDTNCDNSPILTSEDYPPLEVRTLEFCTETVKRSRSGARDSSVTADRAIIKTDPVIPGRESGDGPHSLPTDFLCVKSSDTSSNKRPPVILMHDPSRGDSRVPEIQFGFPVNYQLLQSEDTECNETVDSPPPPPIPDVPTPAPVVRDQGHYSFIQDQNLAQYLSATWEETMEKVRSGKARYYDGQ